MDLKKIRLILLGHGASEGTGAAECVIRHSERLRSSGVFAEVLPAFVRQEPFVEEVIKESRNIPVVVPFFMSDGYILKTVCSRLEKLFKQDSKTRPKKPLASNDRQKLNVPFYFAKPVGTHWMMSQVIKAQAQELLHKFSAEQTLKFSEISLFIAAHGCCKDPSSKAVVEAHIKNLRAERIFSDIHPIFIEERPYIKECYKLAKKENIVIVPFFAGAGIHVIEDIPVLLGADRREVIKRIESGLPPWENPTKYNGKIVWYTNSVGCSNMMGAIVLRRALEAICSGE